MPMMQTFFNEYSTEIIGGIIVSFLILFLSKSKEIITNLYIRRKYSGYIGVYYLYSFASSGENAITVYNISIKSKFGRLIAKAEGGPYKYKGTMDISERNIYINLNGINHIEKIQLIFYSPLHRVIKNLIGAVSAITVIDEPFSSICVLSDKKMEEQEVKDEFKRIGLTYKNSIFKVPKDYTIFSENTDKEAKEKLFTNPSN